ncbi:hypothetical protein [Planococcus donghaensis]|uniref:hypothetical protein n=1 Tax=Planococcus donghaensis TaxID=414778 RepID=UPI0037363E5B
MKKSTKNIITNFPKLREWIEDADCKETDPLSNHEEAIVRLARFFEYSESVEVNLLFSEIHPDWIPFVLDQLQTYYYEDSYLTKTAKPLILHDATELLNQKDVAALMNQYGYNMDVKKIHMYRKRGKLPTETICIANKPYWLKEDITHYFTNLQNKENQK